MSYANVSHRIILLIQTNDGHQVNVLWVWFFMHSFSSTKIIVFEDKKNYYINFYRGSNVKLCRNHLGFLINTNYMRNIPVKFDWFQKRIIYQLFFPWHLTSWSFCLCNIFKLSYTVSIQHTVSVTQLSYTVSI